MDNLPSFSIVVPTYNRPNPLAACLAAINQLNYPTDRFELIVADDGSSPTVRDIVDRFVGKMKIRFVQLSNGGPARARNIGATHAAGEFIAFTDDDCRVDPDWLNALAVAAVACPDHLIGGQVQNALSDNLYAEASQLLVEYLYSHYTDRRGLPRFFTSNNMALSAESFHRLGGFDTKFGLAAGEDRDFCHRWRHGGGRLHYAPDALIRHFHTLTAAQFWRQHANYGRGARQFHQQRAVRERRRVRIERPRFYYELIRYPLRERSAGCSRKMRLALLLAIAQVGNGYGFWRARN